MRIFLAAIVLTLVTAAAQAQVFAVSFKDEKAEKKYKNHLVLIAGEQVVVGEGKYAIYLDDGKINYDRIRKNELWVCDPADPAWVPYKYKDGERVPTNPKAVVEISGKDIKNISVLLRDESLQSLAEEYRERLAKIQELSGERDAADKGSREWFMAHQRMLSNYERLQNWLSATWFHVAAEKLEKEIERQKKSVQADALAERLTKAKASILLVETHPMLADAAQTATGGKLTFKIQESLHARMVYRTDISDERIHGLLELVEEMIDGFRGDCVDPYLDADFEDKIPDRKFAEWCFGPTDFEESLRFIKAYYGKEIKDHLEERAQQLGTVLPRALPPESVHFWRYEDRSDLEGDVAHGLGHDLTSLHYNRSLNMPCNQDWLFEAVGFYISLEFLGRNTVTCREFKESKYVKDQKKEGLREAKLGLRDVYNALALDSGPAIDKLVVKELFSLEEADVAKSWSFYDYIVKKEGKKGQHFLRALCTAAKDKPTLLQKWREASNLIFDVREGDVLRVVDERWREFAQSGQETGDTARRGK